MTLDVEETVLIRIPNSRRAFYVYKHDAPLIRTALSEALDAEPPAEIKYDEVWVSTFTDEERCEQCGASTRDEQSVKLKYWTIGNQEGMYTPRAPYCRDCASNIIDALDHYIDGREHELLGQTL